MRKDVFDNLVAYNVSEFVRLWLLSFLSKLYILFYEIKNQLPIVYVERKCRTLLSYDVKT